MVTTTLRQSLTSGFCGALSGLMLLPALPAQATSAAYSGFVSQLPAGFTAPPDVNMMFILDNSTSMVSEAIPDLDVNIRSKSDALPTDDTSNGESLRRWPLMWYQDATKKSSFLAPKYYKLDNAVARYLRSAWGNALYYDPRTTYRPWPKADDNKVDMPEAVPSQVLINFSNPMVPDDPAATNSLQRTTQVDLTLRVGTAGEDNGFWPATYFVYTGAAPLDMAVVESARNVPANFTKVEITDDVNQKFTYYGSRTDCKTGASATPKYCSRAEELQNFANWLQYYRNRRLMAKGGTARAFSQQGANMRVGFAGLARLYHKYTITTNEVVDGLLIERKQEVEMTGPRIDSEIRPFSGTNRANFFNSIYNNHDSTGGTPLRLGLDLIGQYYQRPTDINSPWAEQPGMSIGKEHACRRNFTILSTDGYWNSSPADTADARANNATFSGSTPPKPDGKTYEFSDTVVNNNPDPLAGQFTINPFAHPYQNTLADVAAYYWKTDLRPDLGNNVSSSGSDPAFWQHMSTFTVGLGIYGSGQVKVTSTDATADLSTVGRQSLIANRTPVTWTSPKPNYAETGDDLIHAAMVSRGNYFSAGNAKELSRELSTALAQMVDQPMDRAAAYADVPRIVTGKRVYQATFNPSGWYGRLYSFKQNEDCTIKNKLSVSSSTENSTRIWEASHKMPTPDSRNIFTMQSPTGPGVTFQWANLTAAQQLSLKNDATMVDYLRGSPTTEIRNGGNKRNRPRYTIDGVEGGILGDVVNGSPIKGPDYGGGYDRLPADDPAQSSYATFRTTSSLKDLSETIFLNSNDGMLHGFNMNDGVERFAFVPNAVYSVPRSTATGDTENKLGMLADPGYTHRFLVDGPPNIGDAYIDGKWRSILASSHGAGARSVFAVDVTNPVVGTGGFGNGSLMWELGEGQDADMGFVMDYPHIVRMRNGKWAMIFGNGPDSGTGKAKLYIRDLKTGDVIKDFTFDPDDTTGNNGLSQPNFVLNSEREVIAIYAGDLKGNLWKVNTDNAKSDNWKISFSGKPMFRAVNADGQAQPITVMPEISNHPKGGAMVIFGTGRMFEASDTATSGNVNLFTQSIYGIWDNPAKKTGIAMTAATRSTVLQPQSKDATLSSQSISPSYEATTANTMDWDTRLGWFIDLKTGVGERVNLTPQQVKNVVFVVANTPVTDPCSSGGSARVFALDPWTGGRPEFAVFDVNRNAAFESNELNLNVALIDNILTQPFFQMPSQKATLTSDTGATSPFPLFDRGQASAARMGGVELLRATGGTVPGGTRSPCELLLTAAQSNTTLLSHYIQTCKPSNKLRISWRQLR